MINVLKIEILKVFKSKTFIIILAVASIIAVLAAVANIERYQISVADFEYANSISTQSPDIGSFTLYNTFLCEDYISLAAKVFFFVLPVFCSCAYGWSYFLEKKSGYIKNVLNRTTKKKYFISKYSATFLSGGLIGLIPTILNFVLIAMFIPAYTPEIFYPYHSVCMQSMFSSIYYNMPLIYSVLRLALVFIFSGLFASVTLALSFFVKNRIAIVILPFLLCLGIQYGENFLFGDTLKWELSPTMFLDSNSFVPNGLVVVLIEMAVLFIITLGITVIKGEKNDVF